MYQNTYKETLDTLEERYRSSVSIKPIIRNELEALYSYQGLGWAGRGMIKDSEISASIAAYEAFLFRRANSDD